MFAERGNEAGKPREFKVPETERSRDFANSNGGGGRSRDCFKVSLRSLTSQYRELASKKNPSEKPDAPSPKQDCGATNPKSEHLKRVEALAVAQAQ